MLTYPGAVLIYPGAVLICSYRRAITSYCSFQALKKYSNYSNFLAGTRGVLLDLSEKLFQLFQLEKGTFGLGNKRMLVTR